MVQEVVALIQLCPALEVTVYSKIADPPVTTGASQVTSAETSLIAIAETAVGESGRVMATVTSGSWVRET